MSAAGRDKMRSLEEKLGYRFSNAELLRHALTHKSYASETRSSQYNERLEFLGDSVLGLCAAHFVYDSDPDCMEGRLAKLKSRLVSKPVLAQWAASLNLGQYLYLGAGEESGGGRTRESILANAMEAVLGAMYLDGGLAPVMPFVRGALARMQTEHMADDVDHKSRLQEIIQKRSKTTPEYEVTQTVGPEHNKTFTVTVRLGASTLGTGKGHNKKEAEQSAAKDALEREEGQR